MQFLHLDGIKYYTGVTNKLLRLIPFEIFCKEVD